MFVFQTIYANNTTTNKPSEKTPENIKAPVQQKIASNPDAIRVFNNKPDDFIKIYDDKAKSWYAVVLKDKNTQVETSLADKYMLFSIDLSGSMAPDLKKNPTTGMSNMDRPMEVVSKASEKKLLVAPLTGLDRFKEKDAQDINNEIGKKGYLKLGKNGTGVLVLYDGKDLKDVAYPAIYKKKEETGLNVGSTMHFTASYMGIEEYASVFANRELALTNQVRQEIGKGEKSKIKMVNFKDADGFVGNGISATYEMAGTYKKAGIYSQSAGTYKDDETGKEYVVLYKPASGKEHEEIGIIPAEMVYRMLGDMNMLSSNPTRVEGLDMKSPAGIQEQACYERMAYITKIGGMRNEYTKIPREKETELPTKELKASQEDLNKKLAALKMIQTDIASLNDYAIPKVTKQENRMMLTEEIKKSTPDWAKKYDIELIKLDIFNITEQKEQHQTKRKLNPDIETKTNDMGQKRTKLRKDRFEKCTLFGGGKGSGSASMNINISLFENVDVNDIRRQERFGLGIYRVEAKSVSNYTPKEYASQYNPMNQSELGKIAYKIGRTAYDANMKNKKVTNTQFQDAAVDAVKSIYERSGMEFKGLITVYSNEYKNGTTTLKGSIDYVGNPESAKFDIKIQNNGETNVTISKSDGVTYSMGRGDIKDATTATKTFLTFQRKVEKDEVVLDGNNIYRSDGEYLKVARIFPEKPLTVADYAQKVSKGQEMDGAYSPNKAYRIEQDKTGAPVLKLIYGTSELQNLPVINLSTPKYIDDQEEVGQVIAFNKKP